MLPLKIAFSPLACGGKTLHDLGGRTRKSYAAGIGADIGGGQPPYLGLFGLHFALQRRDSRLIDILYHGQQGRKAGLDHIVTVIHHPLDHQCRTVGLAYLLDAGDVRDIKARRKARSDLGGIPVDGLLAAEDKIKGPPTFFTAFSRV